jgi:hypothetical protein
VCMIVTQTQHEFGCEIETAVARRARRVGAYPAVFQRRVQELAALSPAIEDLVESFPGLLFALATGYATPERRAAAMHLVASGNSLRQAADALDLPLWLRKLPPSAFQAPLVKFPTDAAFSMRMASLVPSEADACADWLEWVSEAMAGHGAEYALWMARYGHAVVRHVSVSSRRLMAAWSWFGAHPECGAAQLLRRRWTPEMSPRRALDEFHVWRDRLALADWLGTGRMEPWISGGTAQGYAFEPLLTAAAFIAAGSALDNCLDQFAAHLRRGHAMVAVIRKAGRIIGCVEIGLTETEVTMPRIVQLRGVKNKRLAPEVWQAAFLWLGSQPIEPFTNGRLTPASVDRTRARRELWKDYFRHLEAVGDQAAMVSEIKKVIRRSVLTPMNIARTQVLLRAPLRPNRSSPRSGRNVAHTVSHSLSVAVCVPRRVVRPD